MDVEERWEISAELYENLAKMSSSELYENLYNIAELSDRQPILYGFHNPRIVKMGDEHYIIWRRRSEI